MKADTKENIIQTIEEYFKENEDVFNDCIEELDSYNGYLGDDRYYEMEMLDELFNGESNIYILQRAYYGWDEDSYQVNERGEKEHYNSFCPNRDYFKFNGYGNLVSTDYKDYSDHIDTWAIENMIENREYIDAIDDDETLKELFDAIENIDDDEMEDC